MYQCSHCGGYMSTPLDRCPKCGVLLSGVKCQACQYMGTKTEFINNGNRCPNCNSVVHITGAPQAVGRSEPGLAILGSFLGMISAMLGGWGLSGLRGESHANEWHASNFGLYVVSCCGLAVGAIAPFLGLLAVRKIRNSHGDLGGNGWAWAGVVLGVLGIVASSWVLVHALSG
jgi:hypothetical protein